MRFGFELDMAYEATIFFTIWIGRREFRFDIPKNYSFKMNKR